MLTKTFVTLISVLTKYLNHFSFLLGASLCSTDDRYCIDNGAMIAHTGNLMFVHKMDTSIEKSGITQRFRTDEVHIAWRD